MKGKVWGWGALQSHDCKDTQIRGGGAICKQTTSINKVGNPIQLPITVALPGEFLTRLYGEGDELCKRIFVLVNPLANAKWPLLYEKLEKLKITFSSIWDE